MKNIILILGILIVSMLFILACSGERYRTDRKNKMTRKAKIASNYLANQAVEITQENIDNKNSTNKKARKNLLKQQRDLNDANSSTSKVKLQKKHSGNFKFY